MDMSKIKLDFSAHMSKLDELNNSLIQQITGECRYQSYSYYF